MAVLQALPGPQAPVAHASGAPAYDAALPRRRGEERCRERHRAQHRGAAVGGAGVRASGRPSSRARDRHGPGDLRAGERRPRGVLGGAGGAPSSWFAPWDTVMEWTPPWVKWFTGGTLNASYNCLDRHVEAGGGDKVAFHWEGEPGDTRDDHVPASCCEEVCRLANALKALGVGKGDRVDIYLGMVPELPVAMLACARIGAPHSVVFGGFCAEALKDRINDAEAKVLITADGAWRRGHDRAAQGERRRGAVGVPHDRARRHRAPLRATSTRSRRDATTGTTSWSRTSPRSARPSRWTPRTSCTCCTRAAPPASRRASRTPPAAT